MIARVAQNAKERFILDTGMVGYRRGALRADLFYSLAGSGKLHPLKMSFDESAVGKSAHCNGPVDSLALGKFSHRDLIFAKQGENLLGLNYLSRYLVTFDFPNRTVNLKKSSRINSTDAQDRSGLYIVRISEGPVVDSVDPGSPAALAGIRYGDEILRISDQDAEWLSLISIRKLCCRPGDEVRLVVRRDGQVIASTMVFSK